uniref:Uncharacterized protein n=1 Tax=Scleropages formosus TaxID=113540 RepID=A0A8C9WQR2_SCLFO
MLCTKLLSQSSQRKGRSPECVRKCSRRWVFWRNRLPHCVQGKGRSPVWTRWCRATPLDDTKSFPHTGHWWPFPRAAHGVARRRPAAVGAWLNWCSRRLAAELRRFPHWEQSRPPRVTKAALSSGLERAS